MNAPSMSALFAAADPAAKLSSNWLACPTFWAVLCGAVGLWLLIPGGVFRSKGTTWLGGLLVAASSVLFAADLPTFGDWGVQTMFWLLAIVTLGSGVAMISSQSPVYSALWFAMSLLGVAGLLLLQGAQFLGGATIVVYAGAIVVTFLFVIMLAQPEGHAVYDRISWGWFPRPAAIFTAAILLGALVAGLGGVKQEIAASANQIVAEGPENLAAAGGILNRQHMANLGRRLFTEQLIAVEVAGTLLLAALVGAVAIAIHGKAEPTASGEQARTPRASRAARLNSEGASR